MVSRLPANWRQELEASASAAPAESQVDLAPSASKLRRN
jgi:hypothetical protein